jgi:hypothetical protein
LCVIRLKHTTCRFVTPGKQTEDACEEEQEEKFWKCLCKNKAVELLWWNKDVGTHANTAPICVLFTKSCREIRKK